MSQVKIQGNASGTGAFTIAAPNSNTDTDYLRHIYYDCITYNPGALQYLVSVVGATQVMFGTDWPHQVHDRSHFDAAGCDGDGA